jgi:hypothetical protein
MVLAIASILASHGRVYGDIVLDPLADMVLDDQALVMPDNARFSRHVNGSPYRVHALLTHGGYQFATWYHAGPGTDANSQENIYISRRRLTGTTWETIDTGEQMVNGDGIWDSHNVISMGISSDGRIHLAYDMHNHGLRYLTTPANRATSSNWGETTFNEERSSLNNISNTSISNVTYPRFITNGDDLLMTYRTGGSGNGDVKLVRYDASAGLPHRWVSANGSSTGDLTQTIISRSGSYTNPFDNSVSTSRNAYLNGVDVDSTGRIHMTWTWREDSRGSNHDINYAYSDDNGSTWRNNSGQSLGSTISINSPGIIVKPLDLRQSLANQQGQIVDSEGGVHALMHHRRQEPGFEWEIGDGLFHKADAAYFHYYRDPTTGQWIDSMLPTNRSVGSRPNMAIDGDDNLFAVYTTPAFGNQILTIAAAEKLASGGYDDWEIVVEDHRDFSGTPFIDRIRLLDDGILSIYVQEDTDLTGRTGTNLRVLEFGRVLAVPEPGSLLALSTLSALLYFRRRRR